MGLERPAARAASRAFGASLMLGAFGLGCAAIVLIRLVESWRVNGHRSSHHITLFGQSIGYPTANLGAIIVLVLALPALVALALAVLAGARELHTAARLRRELGALERDPARLQLRGGEAVVGADVRLLEAPAPLAFVAGLLRPRIYVSTGAAELLDPPALAAVIAHERHHAARRDPLRLAIGRVLHRSLFFVPGLATITRSQVALAELSADEAAVALVPGGRPALARAVLQFADAPGGAGISSERVDQLLGEEPGWTFPASLAVAGVLLTLLVATFVLLVGRLASGSATLAPPFLSRQPCILTLAALTAALVLLAAAAVRRSVR